MSVFLFQILPLLALAALVAGVILIARGIARGSRKARFTGIGLTALSMLLIAAVCLSAFARM